MSATKLCISCPSTRPRRHSSSAVVPWLRHHGGGGGQGERGGGWGIATHIESAAGTGGKRSPDPLLDGGLPSPHLDGMHCRRSSPAAGNRLPYGSSPHCRRRRPLPVGVNRRGAWGGLQPNGRFVVSLGCLRQGYLGPSRWPAGLQGSRAPSRQSIRLCVSIAAFSRLAKGLESWNPDPKTILVGPCLALGPPRGPLPDGAAVA